MGAERGKKGNKFKIFLLYRFVLSYTLIAKQLEFENDNGKSATTLFSLKMHLDLPILLLSAENFQSICIW